MSTRAIYQRWANNREERQESITFVHNGKYFQTWGEDAQKANQAAGSYQLPKVGCVYFLSIAEKYWQEGRDAILAAGYTINVV